MSDAAPRVLLVEDEPDIRTIAELALGQVGGFEVSAVSSGASALEFLNGTRPDVILLDVMMPTMDGIETYRRIRLIAGMAEVPVIFITARVQSSERAEYRQMGAVGVISKPFDPMTLASEVRRITGLTA